MRTPGPRLLRRATQSTLRRFRRDRRGATAIEYALIATPFLSILCAIFEIGYVHIQSELLENAVANAARAMLTGRMQAASVSSSSQFISKYLCPTSGRTLPASFDCSKLIVDVRPAATFVAGDTSNTFYKSSSNEFCPGQPGQIVVLRVAYSLGSIFPLSLFNRSMGVVNDVPSLPGRYHIIMGEALFQEENYAGTYTSPQGC